MQRTCSYLCIRSTIIIARQTQILLTLRCLPCMVKNVQCIIVRTNTITLCYERTCCHGSNWLYTIRWDTTLQIVSISHIIKCHCQTFRSIVTVTLSISISSLAIASMNLQIHVSYLKRTNLKKNPNRFSRRIQLILLTIAIRSRPNPAIATYHPNRTKWVKPLLFFEQNQNRSRGSLRFSSNPFKLCLENFFQPALFWLIISTSVFWDHRYAIFGRFPSLWILL